MSLQVIKITYAAFLATQAVAAATMAAICGQLSVIGTSPLSNHPWVRRFIMPIWPALQADTSSIIEPITEAAQLYCLNGAPTSQTWVNNSYRAATAIYGAGSLFCLYNAYKAVQSAYNNIEMTRGEKTGVAITAGLTGITVARRLNLI